MKGTVGVIGYGRFGALMARYLAADFSVQVWDPAADSVSITAAGAFPADLLTVAQCDTVIPAVPISQLEAVLYQLRPMLKSGALLIDVCSVKEQPIHWMQRILPESVEILGTHPMFGPDSAADSLHGRKIVLCRVRTGTERYVKIKTYLESKGLVVIETSAEEHDSQIAVSLGLTHFIGRALAGAGARPLAIDTEGYRRLLRILEVVENDSWQLFEDMHRYNLHAEKVRQTFVGALRDIEKRLKE
jgi:prephenate dehydrogenase